MIQIMATFLIVNSGGNKSLFSVLVLLIFVGEGAHYVLFPSLTVSLYGPLLGANIYSIMFIGFGVAACEGIIISELLVPLGWNYAFYFLGVSNLISAVLVFFY